MNDFLKKSYLSRLIKALSLLNGSEFEKLGHSVLQQILNCRLNHRGLTISGAPSGYTVDSYSDDLTIIGEYSVENDYFSKGFAKILKDLKHALDTSSNLKTLYLFTSQLPGPKQSIDVRRTINNVISSVNRDVNVEIFDANNIANYLISKLGEMDSSSDLVIYLPELENILHEHVMTNTIPQVKGNYLYRSEEDETLSILEKENVVLIHGISGIGKTEIAISVANKIKNQFEMTVWIDGKDVYPESLTSIYVERARFKQNLIGLFHRRKLLLVVDGLENQISEIIKILSDSNKHDSKIIITSQNDDSLVLPEQKKMLSFLNKNDAKLLLNSSVDSFCPDSIFDSIYNAISGYPLLLSIINKLIRFDNISWGEIEEDVSSFPTYEDDKGQLVLDRLLGRHMKSIEREIATLKWLDTSVISEALLIKLISKIGLKKLRDRAIVSDYGINGLKMHDLIFRCISLKSSNIDFSSNFERQFISFFKDHLVKKDYVYFRTLHLHKEKLLELVSEYSEEFALIYASLEYLKLDELIKTLDKIKIQQLLDSAYYFKQEEYFRILTFIECIEDIHRLKKWRDLNEGVAFAEEQIPYLEKLLEIKQLDKETKYEIMHHLGKFQLFTKNIDAAEECFRQVISNVQNPFHSYLQLLKLIYDSKTEEARSLLKEIFRSFQEDRQKVSISIVLAAFNELKKPQFKEIAEEYLYNGTLFEETISMSSIWGFTQPFQVLTEIGKSIAYHDPKRFIKIMEMIPEPSEDSSFNDLLFYSGQLYKLLGKCYEQVEGLDSQNRYSVFELSKMYYEKMHEPNTYQLTQICELYQLMGLPRLAIDILNSVPEKERQSSFWHYRYSLSLYELNQLDKALSEVGTAINMIKESDKRFKAAFLFHKAQILEALGDKNNAFAIYQEAYNASNDDKFKSTIQVAINNLSVSNS